MSKSQNKIHAKLLSILFAILFFSTVLSITTLGSIKTTSVKVTKITDGDTLHVSLNEKDTTIRMIGINTPELSHKGLNIKEQPLGKQITTYTSKKLLGKIVYIEFGVQPKDRYGRLLVYVWLKQPESYSESEIKSKMFNAHLLLNGYAQVMTIKPNTQHSDIFNKFQNQAIQNKKGIWGSGIEKPNDRYKNTSKTQTSTKVADISSGTLTKYIASINSKKFHKFDCSLAKKIGSTNTIYFKTREDAISKGYDPCKVCNP